MVHHPAFHAAELGNGVWMAFHPGMDGGPGVPFRSEVEALRHALEFSMQVRFAGFGDADWATRKEPVKPETTMMSDETARAMAAGNYRTCY